MDDRITIKIGGEPRRRLEVIATARGQTLTTACSFLAAEAIEEHYYRILRQMDRHKLEQMGYPAQPLRKLT